MTEQRNSLGSENAFPVHCFDTAEWRPGMTMRDFLAATAMQGMLASQSTVETCNGMALAAKQCGKSVPNYLATAAYIMADAMLRERDREHD